MFFYVIRYINENSILLFHYIYFIYTNFGIDVIYPKLRDCSFLGDNVLLCKSGYYRENEPVIGPVIN